MNKKSNNIAHHNIRAAVFRRVAQAADAVNRLEQIGYSADEISVLCSEDTKEEHFREYEHEDPAGTHTPKAMAAGGLLGVLAGGLATAGISTAAGVSLLAAGPAFLIGAAVAGGFIGAMQTRGMEGTLADYYDQSLTQGDLLVAVTDENEDRLEAAEQALKAAGARPVPLDTETPSI